MSKAKPDWDELPRIEQDKYLERARFLIDNGYLKGDYDYEDAAKEIYSKRRD
jgi:hypothetical protein